MGLGGVGWGGLRLAVPLRGMLLWFNGSWGRVMWRVCKQVEFTGAGEKKVLGSLSHLDVLINESTVRNPNSISKNVNI